MEQQQQPPQQQSQQRQQQQQRQHEQQRLRGGTRQARAVADGLGWFGIGLGLAQLLLPGAVSAAAGVRASRRSVQMCGVREIATGIAILSLPQPAAAVWARVAGDVVDLATLAALADPVARRRHALTTTAVLAIAALDIANARALGSNQRQEGGAGRVYDYSDRSGLARSPEQMRGVARADLEVPRDLRTPPALRPLAAG